MSSMLIFRLIIPVVGIYASESSPQHACKNHKQWYIFALECSVTGQGKVQHFEFVKQHGRIDELSRDNIKEGRKEETKEERRDGGKKNLK